MKSKASIRKIFALLLSLALLFSVCSVGFSAAAEDETTVGYYVLADGTSIQSWQPVGTAVSAGRTGVINDMTAVRVTPQDTGKWNVHVGNAALSDVDAEDVKTMVIYVKNTMDVDLEYALSSSGNDTTAEFGNGTAYLCDEESGYFIPVPAKAYVSIPAGYEGYVIYDLESFDNISAVAALSFAALKIKTNNTEATLGQAWYYSEIAVSTKPAKEFMADYAGADYVSYLLNNGNVGGDSSGFTSETDVAGVSPYGTANVLTVSANTASMITANAYSWNETAVDIDFSSAVISFYAKVDGYIKLDPRVNGEKPDIRGKIYGVSKDGELVYSSATDSSTNVCIELSNFEGMVYIIPEYVETSWGSDELYTWAEYVASNNIDNVAFYTPSGTNRSLSIGSTVMLDNFAVTDDIDAVNAIIETAKVTNPIVTDASWAVKGSDAKTEYKVCGDHIETWFTAMQRADYIQLKATNRVVENPEDVNALSLEIKTGSLNSTSNVLKIRPYLWVGGTGNAASYNLAYGATLVSKDGTVTTAEYIESGETAGIKIPANFEGTVIFDLSDATFTYNSAATSFADIMAANGNILEGIRVGVNSKWQDHTNSLTEIDDIRLVYDDVETYISGLSTDLYDTSYVLNDGTNSGGWGGSAMYIYGWSNGTDGKAASTVTGIHNDVNLVSTAFDTTDKTANATDGSLYTKNGEDALPDGLDLSKATAVSYWISIPDLGDGNYYELSLLPSKTGSAANNIYTKIFAISDDGECIDFGTSQKVTLNNFTGTVYYLIDDETVVTYLSTAGTWSDYIAARKAEVAAGTSSYVINSFALYGYRNTTEAITFYMDDVRLHFGGYMLENAVSKYETTLVQNEIAADEEAAAAEAAAAEAPYVAFSADDLSTAKFTDTAVFTRSVEEISGQTAIHYTRVDGSSCNALEVSYANESTLSVEEIANMEAISMWISIPETATSVYNLMPRINGGGKYLYTSMITVNTKTGEIDYRDSYTAGEQLAAGFEGYVIMPLDTATIKAGYGDGASYTWSELINTDGKFVGYYFYYNQITNLDWYQGQIKLVADISEYLTELGAETVSGDLNYDGSANILDLVRLKKFNAGSATQIAWQNLDVDDNTVVDTAAELVGMKKLLLGLDYLVEPEVEHGAGSHIFHGTLGLWDEKYSDIADEASFSDTYMTADLYEVKQLNEQGGTAWFYIGAYVNGLDSYIFDEKGAGENINEAWKNWLDTKVSNMKKLRIWNTVAGFFYEETDLTDSQFITLTKYLDETYGKRQFACLTVSQVSNATADRYQYITDIGYDQYTSSLDTHKGYIDTMLTNINRTDVNVWIFPEIFNSRSNGELKKSENDMIEDLAMYEDIIDYIDSKGVSFGGVMFYTWTTWSDSQVGLDELISDYSYTALAEKLVQMGADIMAR